MPQSTKDSNGGKSHPAKNKSSTGNSAGHADEKKNNKHSPTGSQKRGEKKTTP